MELTKEDNLLISKLEDLKYRAEDMYIPVSGPFLDMRQRSLAAKRFRGAGNLYFLGGYEDAERTMPVFYEYEPDEGELVKAVRVVLPKGARKLTHRDYLGSLMGLGITREKTGDILVGDSGADILLAPEILSFVLTEFTKAGRENLSVSEIALTELDIGNVNIESVRCSVSSMRLDNCLSGVFNLARGKAQDAIREGLVFVNNIEMNKNDFRMNAGDKLVLRGKGKAVIKEVGETNRKGRIIIKIDKYM